MLHEFLARHRQELVDRWLDELRARLPDENVLTETELLDSFHLYLDETVDALRGQPGNLLESEKSAVARMHGRQRHVLRRRAEDVVHEYALFFEVAVAMAAEKGESMLPSDYLALSACMGVGAKQATAEYVRQRDEELQQMQLAHIGFVAHEIRNPLQSIVMAWELIESGAGDARTASVLQTNLDKVRALVDRSIVDVRNRIGGTPESLDRKRCDLRALLEGLVIEVQADAMKKRIIVESRCEDALMVDIDARVFGSALSNLVRNAIKFSHEGGHVASHAFRDGDRVVIEVHDECGGLPPGRAERLFEAFAQASGDRSGFGLGLAIAREAIEAHGGTLSARNDAPKGCVFEIDMPQAGSPGYADGGSSAQPDAGD